MNVILWIDAIKHPLTGIGRYTYELAKHLLHNDHNLRISFLQNGRLRRTIAQPSEAAGARKMAQVRRFLSAPWR